VPLDPRILRATIVIGGESRIYENLAMTVTGQKYGNPNQGECKISIANLSKDVRDQILTESSPFNRNPTEKTITVEAGRESTGYSVLYTGNIFRADSTQPPDQITMIRALSGQFQKGDIVSRSQGPLVNLSTICQQVASDLGYSLLFEAEDKKVSNYSFNGPAINQIEVISDLSNVDVFIDNGVMVVKNEREPISGAVRVIGPSDIVGKPVITEQGIKVTFLYDTQTRLGGMLDITSEQYPAVSGRYTIYRLGYDLANRDNNWYYIAEATRIDD